MSLDVLEAKGLCAGYNDSIVLQNISFTLQRGQNLVLLGSNGSGKSTLLRCLGGFIKPVSGDIAAKAGKLLSPKARKRARHMAYMAQNPSRPEALKLMEFVMLGRFPWLGFLGLYSALDHQIALRQLAATGLDHLRDRLVGTLSGGEWQRAMLARALTQLAGSKLPVLLLDEFSAGLDPGHCMRMYKLLQGLCANGLSIVCASHDCNMTALFCTHAMGLKDGRQVFFGPVNAVLTENNLTAIYGWPTGVFSHPDKNVPQFYLRYYNNETC